MTYIQRLGQGQRETVSEYTTRKEARQDLQEYRLSDPSAHYYLSTRACNDWRKS